MSKSLTINITGSCAGGIDDGGVEAAKAFYLAAGERKSIVEGCRNGVEIEIQNLECMILSKSFEEDAIVDNKILPYSIDKKEKKSVGELEQEFLQALQNPKW